MFTPVVIIPVLQILVAAVTLLLIASLIALARGLKRLHGRINTVFFILTMTTVLGLEVVIRFANPEFTTGFSEEDRRALTRHLLFSVPAAILLPFMLFSGKTHRSWHVTLSIFFSIFWIGTFTTGIFFLPYSIIKP